MNYQYMKVNKKKKKKAYLRMIDSKMVIAILALLFNDWAGDNGGAVQRTEA